MSILSIEEHKDSIILKNKYEGQVVRLFFQCYEAKSLKGVVGHLNSKNIISINRLYVNPDYRKKRWASIILTRLLEIYEGQSFLVNAYPDDNEYMTMDVLIEFYKKHGFKILRSSEDGMLLIKKT